MLSFKFKSLISAALCLFAATLTAAQSRSAPLKKTNARPQSAAAKTAGEKFDRATIETMAAQCVRLDTEAGAILLEMLPESAPETVRNFLNLTALKAFDTTTFSRVVPNFVIQGGNLSTRQTPAAEALQRRAARTIADEPNQVRHVRGVVSMARGSEPNTASSNFFILVADAPHLDNTFAAFARITKGMETVNQINQAPVAGEKPLKPVRLNSAAIEPCAVQPKTLPD